MRNDVMAHIGWAAALLDKAHPNYYFDRILAGDPGNVYALVLKTTWLLTGRFDSIPAGERFQTARVFFQTAKESERQQIFVVGSGDLQQQVTAAVLKARYQEYKGDWSSALAGYGAAVEEYKNGQLSSAQVVANALPNLIKRVCERINESASDPLCRSE